MASKAVRTASGKWKVQVWLAPGKVVSKTKPTKLLAETWARDVEAKRDRGDVASAQQVAADDGSLTVGDYWRDNVLPARKVRLAKETVKTNLSHWSLYVEPTFGRRSLTGVKRTAVNAWVTKMLADGAGTPTVEKSVNLLSAIFTAAIEDDLLAVNPAQRIKLPEHQPMDRGYLSRAEVDAILSEVAEPYALFLELTVETGMRFGESAGIKRGAVLRDGREIQVATVLTRSGLKNVPKTSKSHRVVPVPEHLRARVLRLVLATPADCLIFTGAHGGGLSDANVRTRILKPACVRAGVRVIGLHHLRHAFASWLTEEGVGSFEVASALGHSTLRMMPKYAHLAPGHHDRVLEALERSRSGSAAAARNASALT